MDLPKMRRGLCAIRSSVLDMQAAATRSKHQRHISRTVAGIADEHMRSQDMTDKELDDLVADRYRLMSHMERDELVRKMADAITALRAEVAALTDRLRAEPYTADQWRALRERAERTEAEVAALRQLLADMKPHWDANTRGRIWTASTAGVMADLRTRLDVALKEGK
jgi:acyl-CoA reductase-like NAD-dependent aldehyde dehydrogenase